MPEGINSNGMDTRGRRIRRRLRGTFTGKKGKALGIASIAAPIVGYIVNDLKKPNGIFRSLIGPRVSKFLSGKTKQQEAIDITDQVEVIEDAGEKSNK